MKIVLNYHSSVPIYGQIEAEILRQIASGELSGGQMLPSIRVLAKDLQVGVITVKRAYDDLCMQGYIVAMQGKGVFVSELKDEQKSEYHKQQARQKLGEVVEYAKRYGISVPQLQQMLANMEGEDV